MLRIYTNSSALHIGYECNSSLIHGRCPNVKDLLRAELDAKHGFHHAYILSLAHGFCHATPFRRKASHCYLPRTSIT